LAGSGVMAPDSNMEQILVSCGKSESSRNGNLGNLGGGIVPNGQLYGVWVLDGTCSTVSYSIWSLSALQVGDDAPWDSSPPLSVSTNMAVFGDLQGYSSHRTKP
jgi:hypothetical protein